MDPRYCSLVQYATGLNTQVASADADVRFTLSAGLGRLPQVVLQELVVATSATVSTITIGRTWNPVPVILPGGGVSPSLTLRMLNILNDVVDLSAMIYLFDIRVRETTPMGPLLWARGAT